MGMDFTHLVLEIEERYAIEIDGGDWVNVRTFGDLVDMVKRKIDRPLDPPIEESRNEIILQSLLAELRSRLPKEVEINEETQLSKLRPYVKQYDTCAVIRQRFPELPSWDAIGFRREYYGDGLSCLGFLGVVVAGYIIYGTVSKYFGESLWTFLMAGAIWMSIGFAWLFWIVLRYPYRTVGGVAKTIAERRQKRLKAREYSSDDIENELRAYMSKTFALKPEKIQRESGLVKDLRLG